MKRTVGILSAVILSGLLYSQCAGGQSVDNFILIPEPSLLDLRDEDWNIDELAMLDHYQKMFGNMSAEQVVKILNENEVIFKFISDSEIQFGVRKNFTPIMASYGCLVRLSFVDGMFNKAEDVSACGVVA